MFLKYYLNSIRLSQACIIFSLAQLILAFSLIVYIGVISNDSFYIEILETILTSLFFLEIMVKLFLEQENFISNNSNLMDLIFFTLVVLMMIVYKALAISEFEDELIPIYLLILRYILHSIRILISIRITHQTRQFMQNSDITFNINDSQIV